MSTKERSEFLKEFEKHKTAAAKAAKVETGSAILSDAEIAKTLDLSENTKKVFDAKLSRVRYGKDKNKNLYISFDYVLLSGKKGLQLGQFIGLDKTSDKYDKNLERVFGTMQRFGIDTTKWNASNAIKNFLDAADALTEEKPSFKLGLSKYIADAKKGIIFINYSILSLIEDQEEESDEEVEEDEYEEVEETEEESEEEETEEVDYSEWVGYSCTFEYDDASYNGTTTAWNEDAGTFDVTDENGDVYELAPDELEWVEE